MKVLIIGGGGREHAVGLALSRSPKLSHLWFAPGNGGTAALGDNVPIAATDLDGILAFCRQHQPDLVAVLPDDPLAMGLVDRLEENGFAAFGPTQAAAEIESSKSYAKAFMERHGIPTASSLVFNRAGAIRYAEICPLPTVIKADGLALGKGVIICHTRPEAREAVETLTALTSGATLLFEEFLEGPEVTQMCFVSGEDMVFMPASQDHKRIFDGDLGPNTGGMGAFSPVSVYDADMAQRCMDLIYRPTVQGMVRDGRPFKGVLYFSLMLTKDGPKVIEYNARFGDPEAQTVLPLLESDLLDIMLAVRNDRLSQCPVQFKNAATCCVIMASNGYPGAYEKGYPIQGLAEGALAGTFVYHAGTTLGADGECRTAGGRVLGVTAVADTLKAAVALAYSRVESIRFEGAFYRKDIAAKDPASR